MIGYFIIVTLIIFLQNKIIIRDENKKLLIALTSLFLFAALRGNGDGDYFVYLRYSDLVTSLSDVLDKNFPMEIGFRIIAYFVNLAELSSQWTIAIMNGISLSCIYFFIKRNSPDKIYSIFLFLPIYFLFDMHAARTAVAISIATLGYKYIMEKNIYKYIFIIFLASMFHKIAIILLLVYLICSFSFSSFFILVSLILTILTTYIININMIILTVLKLFGLNSLYNRFYYYINNIQYGYNFSLLDIRLLLSFIILVLSLIVLEIDKKNETNIKDLKIEQNLVKINWFLLIVMVLFSRNTILVVRLYGLIGVYSIIQIPLILNRYKKIAGYESYIFFKILILFVYIIYIYGILRNYPEYITIFNK